MLFDVCCVYDYDCDVLMCGNVLLYVFVDVLVVMVFNVCEDDVVLGVICVWE